MRDATTGPRSNKNSIQAPNVRNVQIQSRAQATQGILGTPTPSKHSQGKTKGSLGFLFRSEQL